MKTLTNNAKRIGRVWSAYHVARRLYVRTYTRGIYARIADVIICAQATGGNITQALENEFSHSQLALDIIDRIRLG